MRDKRVRQLCLSALMAALIYVFTAFLHVPSATGYTHVGDGFLYLAGCILPAPFAAAAGAIGAGLSDILSGYTAWAPWTIVIKALTGLCFSCKSDKIVSKRNLLALIPALVLCAGGYYLCGAIMAGNFASPVAEIPGNLIQWAFSSVLYVLLGSILDRMKFKQKMGVI